MEHDKLLRDQSKFSNIEGLSVGKIKIQISDKKIKVILFYFTDGKSVDIFITLFLICSEIIIFIYRRLFRRQLFGAKWLEDLSTFLLTDSFVVSKFTCQYFILFYRRILLSVIFVDFL